MQKPADILPAGFYDTNPPDRNLSDRGHLIRKTRHILNYFV